MKSIQTFIVIFFMMLFAVGVFSKSEESTESIATFIVQQHPYNYYFGSNGEGLVRVDQSTTTVFDFGDKPNWFMLTYMYQHEENDQLTTKALYLYPESGVDNPLAASVFTGREIIRDPENPEFVIVRFNYRYPYLNNTSVQLDFTLVKDTPDLEPVSEVWVTLSIDNKIADTSNDLYRLMEVHCPFVRMPPINRTIDNDVLSIDNYLLTDPISNLDLKAEPYLVKNGEVKRHGRRYPNGLQMSTYYEKNSSNQGNGIYMSISNLDHRTCEFNHFKRKIDNWDDWGYVFEPNRPNYPEKHRFLIWDVVHYPDNVNEPENDYDTDMIVAHLRFSQEMDWYNSSSTVDPNIQNKNIAKPRVHEHHNDEK